MLIRILESYHLLLTLPTLERDPNVDKKAPLSSSFHVAWVRVLPVEEKR